MVRRRHLNNDVNSAKVDASGEATEEDLKLLMGIEDPAQPAPNIEPKKEKLTAQELEQQEYTTFKENVPAHLRKFQDYDFLCILTYF